jgi:ABC-type polysaccharide/polyol phosphate transport system ATPase subunit
MRSVAQSGKTVLFVSHDLEILQRISDRAILIRNGRVEMDDLPELVIAEHRAQSKRAHSGDNPSAHSV